MSGPRASTTYKKKDGTLAFSKSKQAVTWTPVAPSGSPAQVTIAIPDITNLQQTPATNPKVALRILVKAAGVGEAEPHVFNFTSTTAARTEQETITDALRTAISAAKAGTTVPAAPVATSEATGVSGPIAFAQAVNSSAKAVESWYDDQRLRSNVELQQSLLKSDPALFQRFEESLREKPDGISNSQFAAQFWGARLHLLRAHAIEKNQSQGTYNVLSEVKPKIVDGATKLNLSKEQIQLIFNQHPLVKQVYNESVPRLSEMEFWARFFVSRLFKKLKGERIVDTDSTDSVLDKYLNTEDDSTLAPQNMDAHIPHYIDLEGNEQNHSQRKGNQPDYTMRPNASDKVPILRVLNSMSEQMMARVAPADGDPHDPIGMDEETFNELRLRDLQAQAGDDRVFLTIKDHGSLFGATSAPEVSAEARAYAAQDPAAVLASLNADLDPTSHPGQRRAGAVLDLAAAIGVHDDASSSDSDSDSAAARPPTKPPKALRIGSRASLDAATAQVTAQLAQARTHLTSTDDRPANPTTLSAPILASLTLTHNTTTEFLHYFWTLFLHTPSSAGAGAAAAEKDLPALLATLANSLARIAAVADAAEAERAAKIADLRRQAAEYTARTGRRRRVDEAKVAVGGRAEVQALMAPTVRAIGVAREAFEKALAAQSAAAAAAAANGVGGAAAAGTGE